MIKKLWLGISLFALIVSTANAQSWQWGKRGGSSSTGAGGGVDEQVVDMATDAHGNVYVLSNVLEIGLNVDGHPETGYGHQDIVLSSFKCDGTYRWSKIIGGNSTDIGVALKTDTIGGVYVLAGVTWDIITGGHIDADATIATTYKNSLIIKYDTAGTYQWHKFPQSDTVGVYSAINTAPVDMDVDNAGNSYCLYQLAPGAYAGGSYVVSALGMYILKYDKTGAFVSGNPMAITFTMGAAQSLKIRKDHGNGKYVVTGAIASAGSLSLGGIPIARNLFVSYFNNAGSLLWLRQNTSVYSDYFVRADIDAAHNIYIAGTSNYFGANDTFNGFIINNTLAPYGGVPLVVKLDTNGNNIWALNGSANAGTSSSAIKVNGAEIALTGQYPGKLKWPGFSDSLDLAAGSLSRIFTARFNAATGSVLGMDSLAGTYGLNCSSTAMTTDKIGNFYVGGDFGNAITVAGTTLITAGGGSDFCIAKYGYDNCNCTTLPMAGFTSIGTLTVNFTYTGTPVYDSVRWDFGDGGTSALATPTHVFAATGSHTICVTVYTPCGSNTHCHTVTTSPGAGIITATAREMNIYPNPASAILFIDPVSDGTLIEIFDMPGRQVYSDIASGAKKEMSIEKLAAGNYIIQITGTDGARSKKIFIKE